MKVGVSFVSISNARANLQRGNSRLGFRGGPRRRASAAGATAGARSVEGGTAEQRTIFYTGLYHMLLSPNLFSDSNGEYIGFDGKVPAPGAGRRRSTRTSPIGTSTAMSSSCTPCCCRQQASQMMQSLVRDARGKRVAAPLAGGQRCELRHGRRFAGHPARQAYAFGARSFDRQNRAGFHAQGRHPAGHGAARPVRAPGAGRLSEPGLCPRSEARQRDRGVGHARICERRLCRFAIRRRPGRSGAMPPSLLRSAQNWRTLFDPETGFIRPRTADGKFLGDWDPDHAHAAPHELGQGRTRLASRRARPGSTPG